MPKALIVASNLGSVASGGFFPLHSWANSFVAEASVQTPASEACSFTNLGVLINSSTGSGTNAFRFRKNAANGNGLAQITGPGTVYDTVNSDTLAAADLYNIAYTDDGTDSAVSWIKANVEFTSGYGNYHGTAATSPGAVFDVPSVMQFIAFAGGMLPDGEATEARAQFLNRAYSSVEALYVRAIANARVNNSVFTVEVNGTTSGSSVTFGSGVTGLVGVTGMGVALAAGDLVCAGITLLTGVEDLTLSLLQGTFKSTATNSECMARTNGTPASRTGSATGSQYVIGGFISNITEARARCRVGFAGIARNLRIYIVTNAVNSAHSLELRKNGVTVITLNIPLSATGWVENTVDTVAFTDTDELCFRIVGGTSGAMTFTTMIVTTHANQNYSLAADPGTYGLTGIDATFLLGRAIAADPGSYAITDTGTIIRRGTAQPALLVGSQGFAAIPTARFVPFGGGVLGTVELRAQISMRQAGTFSALGGNSLGGDTLNILRLRVGGINVNNVVDTATLDGWHEDTVNSDTVALDAGVALGFTSGGTTTAWRVWKILYKATGDHCSYYSSHSAAAIFDLPSTTQFVPLCGSHIADGSAVEATEQLLVRAGGTLRGFHVRMAGNARLNTSDFRVRKNGGFGNGICSFGAGVTGLVVDTTNTDALVSGDLFASSVTIGAGVEDLTPSLVAAAITNEVTSESDVFLQFKASRAASALGHVFPLGGKFTAFNITAESTVTLRHGFLGFARNLRAYISANTYTGPAIIELRISAVSAITLTIPAGVTGWIENTIDTAMFSATDDCCYRISGGTSGSLTMEHVGLTELTPRVTTLAAAAGSYDLTGSPAGLTATRILAATGGVYSLSGADAGLRRDATLAAVSGAYVLDGNAATFTLARGIAADPGTYGLTGFAAALVAGMKLSALPGAYLFTGSVGTLTRRRTLAAVSGAYTITGSAVLLVYPRRIPAESGVYDITGFTARLLLNGWEPQRDEDDDLWVLQDETDSIWTPQVPTPATWE